MLLCSPLSVHELMLKRSHRRHVHTCTQVIRSHHSTSTFVCVVEVFVLSHWESRWSIARLGCLETFYASSVIFVCRIDAASQRSCTPPSSCRQPATLRIVALRSVAMPFHNFGGDASESGDDAASRALPVHDGAAAGSLFGGGAGEEPETVAAYTAYVRDAMPDVDDEGREHAKTVAVCVDSESEPDVWHKRTPAQRRAVKTRKPTAEQQMTKAVAELTSSMLARAATALGISNPPTQQHGPGGVGSEGSGGSGATGLAGSVAGSGGSGEQQTKKEQKEEQKEEQKRQSGHSGCSGGAAEEEGKKTTEPTKRAPRGSAGTFGGRRPPKDPSKLALFEARKAAHAKAKEDAKDGEGKCPSLRQAQYWNHLSENLKAGNGMKAQAFKRPAAAAVDDDDTADVTTPMPKKNKKKDEKKDEKDDETPEKTDEMASGSEKKVNKKPKQ